MNGESTESPIQEKFFTISAPDGGRTVIEWLVEHFPRYDEGTLAQLVHVGRVAGVDRAIEPSTRLVAGERLRLWRPALTPEDDPPPFPRVLYEDEHVVALDKPAGMLVHPAGSHFVWALVGLVRRHRPGMEVHLAHRLDRDTSGVVILAKDGETNRFLKAAFQQKLVGKTYLALVRGRPPWSALPVEEPIGPHPASAIRLKMAVRPDGQAAATAFRVMALLRDAALVECVPRTGRTHQIRVHLEWAGHPILGDRIYGQPEEVFLHVFEEGFDEATLSRVGFPRQALHAWKMSLPLPDGSRIEVRAPLPADMVSVVQAGGLP